MCNLVQEGGKFVLNNELKFIAGLEEGGGEGVTAI